MEKQELNTILDEISSYLYGITIILGLASVMLFIHLGLDFFFHN